MNPHTIYNVGIQFKFIIINNRLLARVSNCHGIRKRAFLNPVAHLCNMEFIHYVDGVLIQRLQFNIMRVISSYYLKMAI